VQISGNFWPISFTFRSVVVGDIQSKCATSMLPSVTCYTNLHRFTRNFK